MYSFTSIQPSAVSNARQIQSPLNKSRLNVSSARTVSHEKETDPLVFSIASQQTSLPVADDIGYLSYPLAKGSVVGPDASYPGRVRAPHGQANRPLARAAIAAHLHFRVTPTAGPQSPDSDQGSSSSAVCASICSPGASPEIHRCSATIAATSACPRPERLWPPPRCALPAQLHGRPRLPSLPPLPGHQRALHRARRTLRQNHPLCPPLALRAGARLHRYLMRPSAQPPQTLSAPNRRAASAPQRSRPGFVSTRGAGSRHPQRVARPTAHGSASGAATPPRTTPPAGRGHRGNASHLLLLLL